MITYAEMLIALADQLDLEGKFDQADKIDKEFEKFLELLEKGELNFDFTFSGGQRDPRGPYSNRGGELPAYAVPGPQANDGYKNDK